MDAFGRRTIEVLPALGAKWMATDKAVQKNLSARGRC